MSLSSLTELRKKQKKLFQDCLQKFTSSTKFTAAFNKAIGKKYKLIQYDSSYKHQSLQILSYQFSSMGGTNHAKILQLSANDHYRSLSLELDHLHNTGLGMIIIDKNNNVCFIVIMCDQYDLPTFNIENKIYHKKHEICLAALENDPMYQQLVLSSNNPTKYGDILVMDKAALRPDLRGKAFIAFDLSHIFGMLLGYKYVYAMETNPYTISLGNQLTIENNKSLITWWKRSSYFDFSHFIFEDGISIDYYFQKLTNIGYNVNKLKKRNTKIGILFGINSQSFTFEQVVENWLHFCDVLNKMKYARSKSKM
eukprot:431563_1